MKVIVFDLDETIGNFEQLGILWDSLESTPSFHTLTRTDLFHILDLFPKLFRPRFFTLMKWLKQNRVKTAIFTNNQGPPEWVKLLAEYTSYKIGKHRAFNRIVRSWKTDGKIVERCRTSHDKRYQDFLKCTGYPKNTKLCFLDDQYHEGMKHENVYYIYLKPYVFHYNFQEMIDKLVMSTLSKKLLSPEGTRKHARMVLRNKLSMDAKQSRFRARKTRVHDVDAMISHKVEAHIRHFLR